ncbi:hypothetical protein H2248_002664 [Termitomyces sp. 'cryptogamus']|nr:hypothetical protein H2248_002664 [Termitomyces sp. 'cryptogamus']
MIARSETRTRQDASVRVFRISNMFARLKQGISLEQRVRCTASPISQVCPRASPIRPPRRIFSAQGTPPCPVHCHRALRSPSAHRPSPSPATASARCLFGPVTRRVLTPPQMPKEPSSKPKVRLSPAPRVTSHPPQRKAAEKAEKAATRSKAKKDPKAPKRALSAYMFFSQDWRERIKAENPDAGFGEVGKLLGAKWKELDDEEKKPYIEQAAKDKTRAEEEKAAYDGKKSAGSGDDDEDQQEDAEE